MSQFTKPQHSQTKVWIVWENGNKKTFYSYDTSGRYTVDPEKQRAYGLDKLKKMVERFLSGDPIEQAIIYDTITGKGIERLIGRQWVEVTEAQNEAVRQLVNRIATA